MDQTPLTTNPTSPPPLADRPPGGLGWLLSGLVMPLGSRTFYRWAMRKPVGLAILFFFFIFTSLIAIITTVNVGKSFSEVGVGIEEAYADGTIPEITIRNGVAQVDAPQPYYFYDSPRGSGEGLIVATDTTGELRGIDETRYTQGFLLTRTELHMLDQNGRYQTLPLSQINDMFSNDTLVIDAASVASSWQTVSIVMIIGAAFGIFFWHFVIGLFLTAGLALPFWGIASLLRRGTSYSEVLIAGLYASVPAFYVAHILNRSSVAFPGLQTLLWLPIWAVVLFLAFSTAIPSSDERPHLRTAWLGVPLLLLLIVDAFLTIEGIGIVIALWVLLLLTILLIVFVRLLLRRRAVVTPQP